MGRAGCARAFTGVGAGQGFLSALFGGAGPFGASFFLAYGLRRGAFVGTTASGMTIINVVKIGICGTFDLLDSQALILALSLGLVMVAARTLAAPSPTASPTGHSSTSRWRSAAPRWTGASPCTRGDRLRTALA
ncbi:MAG: hypothetical protein OXE50_14645 [Chloroflexi bacterium]|nr:hypothetical protein [Chloroflexota bacterium]